MLSIMIWEFIQNQILGMKWMSTLIGNLLEKIGLDTSSRMGGSVQFFLYDVLKITILLCILIFMISYIQSYFPPERSKKIMGRFHGIWANCIAALLGTVTPFCSCSSIPLFIGFTSAGLPLGVTFSFLISSPMVDLGSLVLLMSIFGAKVAIIYLTDPDRSRKYKGDVTIDRYGRRVPKHAHGTTNLKRQTSSTMLITDAVMELYDRIVDENLLIRRINITANRLVDENSAKKEEKYEQLDLFTDYKAKEQEQVKEEAALEREKRMQQTMLTIKKKFGKNAILKGMNLQEGATAKDRNEQIGGHKA